MIAILEQPHVWALLSQGTVNGKIDPVRFEAVAAMAGVDVKNLASAAQRKLAGTSSGSLNTALDEEDYRRSEYQAICDGKGGTTYGTLCRMCQTARLAMPVLQSFFPCTSCP